MEPFVDALRRYDDIESRLTAPVSERMLDLAQLRAGQRVLDLASGCGEPALRAASRVGAQGSVLGLDIAAELIERAREKAQRQALSNVEFRVANAELPEGLPGESFDAATARWGLMGMRSPAAALAQVRRLLAPGAPFVAALWAEPDRVPWAMLPRRVLRRYRDLPALDSDAPGVFRYAELSRIERDLAGAQFRLEHVEEMDVPVIETQTVDGILTWIRDLVLGRLAEGLSERERAQYELDLAGEAEQLRVDGVFRLRGVTRIVLAR